MAVAVPKSEMLITTSWDDGHPLDFRLAELLAKYNLSGTFYIPIKNMRPTLSPAQVRDLAQTFEIGAHTVNHVRLGEVEPARAKAEIVDCKRQLEDIVGRSCSIFCFPGGSYSSAHLDMLREAGFHAARTVELLSLERPHTRQGIAIIPTTIQAYSHGPFSYFRNIASRVSVRGTKNILLSGMTKLWPSLGQSLLQRAAAKGGVFHLWGHSWEIEQCAIWPQVEEMFRVLASYQSRGRCLTNGELWSIQEQ
jgi:peptidoglycan/xylan/chitin deacetylase (PgdA/CDA1 family)